MGVSDKIIIAKEHIHSLIPQRDPITMIDCVYYSDDAVTRTGFHIRENNIFCDNKLFTEPGLVENIAQTAAARVGYIAKQMNKTVPVGFIAAIKQLAIKKLPPVGSDITTEISVDNEVMGITIITGKVFYNKEIIASCEMRIFLEQNENT